MLLLLAATAALALRTSAIETDPAAGGSSSSSSTQGPAYLQLVDTTAGNATAYFDPSNGVCETLGSEYTALVPMDDTRNATVSMRYGTRKLVLDTKDMCMEAFNFTDCTQGLLLPFESMVKVGLSVIADANTDDPINAEEGAAGDIARIVSNEFIVDGPVSASGFKSGGILASVFGESVSVPLSSVNGSISVVTYSGNGTTVSVHFIPAMQSGRRRNIQGVRVTLNAQEPIAVNSGNLVLRNVGQVVSDKWTESVDEESISVVFGFISFAPRQVVEFVVEPMEYGFNAKMMPTRYCGELYVAHNGSSNATLPMNFVANNSTATSTTQPSSSASSSSTTSSSTSDACKTSFSWILTCLFLLII